MTTLPDPPRTALVDPKTGTLTREWTLFFDALRRAIVSGLDDAVGGRLDTLEAESLFDGTSSASGAGSDYNDAAVRARLDGIETELIWLATDQAEAETAQASTDDGDLDALLGPFPDPTGTIRHLQRAVTDAQLVALTAPDPNSAVIRRLTRAVRDLETAQAMATDAAGQIAALVYRLNALETEGSWT
jgi:hypothetical protein